MPTRSPTATTKRSTPNSSPPRPRRATAAVGSGASAAVPTSTSARPPVGSVCAVPTLAERLGHPPDARLLIVNCDDLGFCHAASHGVFRALREGIGRSEEHTSELQSLMRISYAVFCL